MQPSTSIESVAWRHPWQIRLALWRRGLAEFYTELRQHPIALLGGIIVVLFILAAVLAPQLTTHDPELGSLRQRLIPPANQIDGVVQFPLGTDAQGRDLLTRIIFGARISLLVGLLTVAISVAVVTALGALAGYYRGWLDTVLSRFADLLMAFPFLIFAIAMMAFIGPGFGNLIFALTFKGWVEFYRLVRGEMMSEKPREYVEAARALGRSSLAIMVAGFSSGASAAVATPALGAAANGETAIATKVKWVCGPYRCAWIQGWRGRRCCRSSTTLWSASRLRPAD